MSVEETHDSQWCDGFDEGYASGRDDIARETELLLARYRGALERIAGRESGVWGLIASDALEGRRVRR